MGKIWSGVKQGFSFASGAQTIWGWLAPYIVGSGVLGVVIGILGGMKPQGWLLLAACAMLGVAALGRFGFYVSDRWKASRRRAIPVAFKNIRAHSVMMYQFPDWPKGIPQPVTYDFGPVTIANISPTKSANLNLYLHLTAEGWNVKVAASPVSSLGLKPFGVGADHLQNPVHIEPGKAVTGKLIFLCEMPDDEILLRLKGKLMRSELEEHIIVDDLVSGAEVRLSLPASYRGEAA